MVRQRPRTREAFLRVSGVGETKADRYGEAFLAVIAETAGSREDD
jgi:ATP-dependent DNA helicase RecQ